jgi:subtilisin family serine protease
MDASENLASFSNRGDWVVLAAPGVKVPTLGRDRQVAERSGTSWAAAAVAGRLATFATHHPSLRGAPLAAEFLLRETHASQGLEGQVQAARALNELPSR